MIKISNLQKRFDDLEVLRDVNIDVAEGEVVCIIGPSGSGKSTLLRCINQLETPTAGEIEYDGKSITGGEMKLRDFREEVGMVFQRFNLFPMKTVLENVMLAPVLTKKKNRTEAKEKAMELLGKVNMADKANNRPSTLSGGQQQRIAIARAIVNEPKVLLLDEPLGALDLKLRQDMQYELIRLKNELGITFLYVTHDQEEALTMSDTIVVMNQGYIQQIGTPEKIYNEPENAFVADFIGDSNIIDGIMIRDELVSILGQKFPCVDKGFGTNKPVDVVIRPEDVDLVKPEEGTLTGTVTHLIFKGVHYEMEVITEDTTWIVHNIKHAEAGKIVGLIIDPESIHIMRKVKGYEKEK